MWNYLSSRGLQLWQSTKSNRMQILLSIPNFRKNRKLSLTSHRFALWIKSSNPRSIFLKSRVVYNHRFHKLEIPGSLLRILVQTRFAIQLKIRPRTWQCLTMTLARITAVTTTGSTIHLCKLDTNIKGKVQLLWLRKTHLCKLKSAMKASHELQQSKKIWLNSRQ